MLQLGLGVAAGRALDALKDPGVFELLLVCIERLGHAVREDDKEISWLHRESLLLVLSAGKHTHRHTARLEPTRSICSDKKRGIVTTIAKSQVPLRIE